MDDRMFDRLSRQLATDLSRRGLGAIGLGTLTGLGLGIAADAKKKKKKKKKRKKKKRAASCTGCRGNEVCRNGQCVDPSCGSCPAGQECIYGLCQDPTCGRIVESVDCELGQTCCQVKGASTEPVCTVLPHIPPVNECCLPPGATFLRRDWPTRSACCIGNTDPVPNSNRERCCLFNNLPDQGHPELCCDFSGNAGGQSVNGRCCGPSGYDCTSVDLCCNGQGCPESGFCP